MTPRGDTPEGGWESLKVAELSEELESRGLPKSGKKAELVARLQEDDASGGAPEEAEDASEETPAEVEAEPRPTPTRSPRPSPPAGAAAPPRWPPRPRSRPARTPEGEIVVFARARYVRGAPRKARLVMDHIRGKPVEQAQAFLRFAPRAVSTDILKLLNSAVANAESGHELGADELRVRRAFVDEGPTIKRFRPRAMGRATRINKRTSHMTIELTTSERNGR